jgi:hypothetical protein
LMSCSVNVCTDTRADNNCTLERVHQLPARRQAAQLDHSGFPTESITSASTPDRQGVLSHVPLANSTDPERQILGFHLLTQNEADHHACHPWRRRRARCGGSASLDGLGRVGRWAVLIVAALA